MISCLSTEKEFENYEKEFINILRSITAPASSGNQIAPLTTANIINTCDYFPLGKKMTYTYLENSKSDNAIEGFMKLFGSGSKTLSEEYTFTNYKTVNGKIFKGYKVKSKDEAKNGQIFYYNCSNKDIKIHSEIYEWNDEYAGDMYEGFSYIGPVYDKVFEATGRYMTLTELKGSIKTGEIWEEMEYINGKEMKVSTSIEETGLTIVVNEETYKDVIKVVRTMIQSAGIAGQNRVYQEAYYAKGIGKIKVVNTMGNALAVITNTLELISYNIE